MTPELGLVAPSDGIELRVVWLGQEANEEGVVKDWEGIHDVQREDRLIGDQPRQVGSLRRPENSLVDALVKARSDVGREATGTTFSFFSAFSALLLPCRADCRLLSLPCLITTPATPAFRGAQNLLTPEPLRVGEEANICQM
jgi:hypothetical protein